MSEEGVLTEAKLIVDGMLIQNPYFSDSPDIPQRGDLSHSICGDSLLVKVW